MQLYTIHSWGPFGNEAIASCHALMCRKTIEAYEYLLSNIRAKLIERHGNIGAIEFIHVDYEKAAHTAIEHVFPEVEITGCSFHVTQAMNKNLNSMGLRDIWTDQGIVGEWIGCIKALILLPEPLVLQTYQSILQNPPIVDDQQQMVKLRRFAHYFSSMYYFY